MKRNFFITTTLTVVLSCTADYSVVNSGNGTASAGTLTLSVYPEWTETKAQSIGNESLVHDIQLLLFNGSGELYRHHSFTQSEISAGQASLPNVKTGDYSVYAAANAPSLDNVKNITEFLETSIPLGEYNSPSDGFVMCSDAVSVTVGSGSETVQNIRISRYVSRVTLSGITNGIPASFGALQINNIFLTNVVGNQTISGDAAPSVWYNCQGVADETSRTAGHIIGTGSWTASLPELTFSGVNESVSFGECYDTLHRFYGYANPSTVSPSGFSSVFSSERCALVVSASFNGRTYYYPVVLKNGFDRNTAYDVRLTIMGEGTEDPDLPVVKGSLDAMITVTDWSDGTSYIETM